MVHSAQQGLSVSFNNAYLKVYAYSSSSSSDLPSISS